MTKRLKYRCSNCGLFIKDKKGNIVLNNGLTIKNVLFGKCKCGSIYYPLETTRKISEIRKNKKLKNKEEIK